MTYELTFHSYCGMCVPLATDDLEECRKIAARQIRATRRSQREVVVLVPGSKWEFLTPDDAAMVADNEGVMSLKEVN